MILYKIHKIDLIFMPVCIINLRLDMLNYVLCDTLVHYIIMHTDISRVFIMYSAVSDGYTRTIFENYK